MRRHGRTEARRIVNSRCSRGRFLQDSIALRRLRETSLLAIVLPAEFLVRRDLARITLAARENA